MTLILHLGVVDIPYKSEAPTVPKRVSTRARRRGKRDWVDEGAQEHSATKTTGDVATILEDHYHIMEVFIEEGGGAEKLEEVFRHSAENAMEAILKGAPSADLNITGEATSEIEAAFKIFLALKLMDGLFPGVPTKASLKGINHRLKHPYAKGNKPRPSFIDTGLYQSSFKAWTDK